MRLLVLLVICSALPTVATADGRRPQPVATVRVEGVVVAPGKLGGNKWDGSGAVSASDLRRFNDALVKFAATTGSVHVAGAALVTTLGTIAMGAFDRPDPSGAIELFVDGKLMGQRRPLRTVQDSFTPQWPGLIWEHVPLDRDVRIRLELADADFGANDPIGTVIVNSSDLRNALVDGRVFLVNVSDQSSNQLIAVKVSVMLESGEVGDGNEISAVDAAGLVVFIDKLAEAVIDNKDDCKQMARSINALFDASLDLIARAKAAEASGKKIPKAVEERMKKRLGEMAGTMQKCGSDADVQAALQRLTK